MMKNRVVSDNGLRATESGFAIDVRLPWYRSLPLSTVDIAEIILDGETIDLADVTFELEGQTLRPDDLRALTDQWWYVLDSAWLNVKHAPIAKGSAHDVAVTLAVRPPYIKGLVRLTKTEKRLVAN
ncbi:conserved hypothetical protein [Paraburkholderia tropica]|uniref:C-glycoside deglycosidase beta subunit domain-containing protein n=1 Tax=Paraburkholderia TaxID=1822464 RepID=UPI001CB0CE39|nr:MULTISPECIES: DUF6379 domain-containing protein [Paraburkholderia]CAG9200742.1 conserved hypothetical protein [Paraburkholderia tropica]